MAPLFMPPLKDFRYILDRDLEADRERQRETERDRERQRERQRQRDRKRERGGGAGEGGHSLWFCSRSKDLWPLALSEEYRLNHFQAGYTLRQSKPRDAAGEPVFRARFFARTRS